MGGQLHSTGEETKVWERKGPAELKRRQLHTTCPHVILRRVAKECELEDIQDKGEQEKGDISLGERPEGKGKGLKGAWP